MNSLQKKYEKEIVPLLKKEFKITNNLAVPKIMKVVVSISIGDIVGDKKSLEKAKENLKAITGQSVLVCPAKRAIADFKIREGNPVGLKATLRRKRMYQFLHKLFCFVLPGVRDFQGVKRSAFDKQANYNLGLKEQVIFPETDYDKIDKVRGLEISIIISTNDKKQALKLLELMGMPFEKRRPSKQ